MASSSGAAAGLHRGGANNTASGDEEMASFGASPAGLHRGGADNTCGNEEMASSAGTTPAGLHQGGHEEEVAFSGSTAAPAGLHHQGGNEEEMASSSGIAPPAGLHHQGDANDIASSPLALTLRELGLPPYDFQLGRALTEDEQKARDMPVIIPRLARERKRRAALAAQ